MANLRFVFFVFMLTAFVASPADAVIYVKADAAGAGNGTSWEDAYTSLQATLAVTVPGDTLWVAVGTYTPTPVFARGVSFWIRQGVVIYGGFAGTETSLEQRDIDANPTILSGEIGDPGPDDNSYHVLVGGGSDSTGVIDGFVVTGGNADYGAGVLGGGGMMIHNGESPTVVNITFRENFGIVGGAMYILEGAAPTFVDVKLIDNTATGGISMGGGVRIDESTPTFRNAWFSGNTARLGGGMYVCAESDVTLINTVFYNNIATDDGGTEGWGGGIYMNNSYMTITNATFADNWADVEGGGLYSAEFGIIATVALTNSIFWGNMAGTSGDQIANIEKALTTIDHSLIEGCGGSGPYWDRTLGVDAGNNIAAEPFFVDRANGNLRLLFASPAMEAGYNGAPDLPATDLDGKPRIIGLRVDMGPYETTPICPPANVFYVDESATGEINGTSWTDAFTDLVIALRALDLCPGVDEIWVAGGSYDPALTDNRDETFRLRDGLSVYGGFEGTETVVSQRDVSANPAILTGEIGGYGMTGNSYHVVTSDGNDSTAVLDGFTIERGNAAGAPLPHGGGMIALASSPTIRNIVFTENEGAWGGGLYAGGGEPTFSDVVFENNTAWTAGGGAAITNAAGALLSNVRFEDNIGMLGGGLYVQLGSVVLVNPVFVGNLAINWGGGIHSTTMTQFTITNATMYGNTAVYGGALSNTNSDPVVTNTILWGNSGAEIYNLAGSEPVLSHSLVEGSGGSGAGWDPSLGIDGGNNLDTDPLFIDAPAGNLRLTQSSPAVDAGDNSAPHLPDTDHDGGPRILHGVVDIGAYEEDTGTAIGDSEPPVILTGPVIRSLWPNPFNPVLSFEIELDRERPLRIEIYNIRGQLVRRLHIGTRREGVHTFTWDGTDDGGRRVASGVYLLRFKSEGWRAYRKAVLLK